MSMIQCANGHFFNSAVNQHCPHCQGQVNKPGAGGAVPNKTVGVTPPQPPNPNNWNAQAQGGNQPVVPPPKPQIDMKAGKPPRQPGDEGKTVGLFMKKEGIDPVVGWFVCIEGKDRGADYRIHSERNAIGRSASNDIAIGNDETISRENHAAVVYDPKRKNFRLLAGGGRGLVYVNDEAVDYSVPLKEGDTIELGETKLLFVPLCGEDFDW
jgi:hypothetical protein